MRIELPHDAWADVVDPDAISRKAARKFRKVLYKVAASTSDVDPNAGDDQIAELGKALGDLVKTQVVRLPLNITSHDMVQATLVAQEAIKRTILVLHVLHHKGVVAVQWEPAGAR